jgi:hypothetical protein
VIHCFSYGHGAIAFSLHFGEGAGKFFHYGGKIISMK